MTDKPISPLRQRMIDDMTARRIKEKVQKDYVRHVRTFAAFLGRSPDTATSEDLRRFQVHLAQLPIGVATINAAIAALRFFFNVTLERPDLVRPLTTVNTPRRAPVVLSQEEVARLLEAAPGLKYKAALSVAYGAGLRVSEVVALKVSDHDARRPRVHPPLSPSRAAERLPPHPPLRPHRRRGSRSEHRARPAVARRGRECAPAFVRGRQSG